MSSPTTILHRPPLAAAITWLLPPALAIAAIGVYFGLIAPPEHHPWYISPPPKPGQSMSARAMRKGKGVESDVYFRMRLPAATTTRPPSPRAAVRDKDDDGKKTPRPSPATRGAAAKTDDAAKTGDAATGDAATGVTAMTTPRPRATVDALWAEHKARPLAEEPDDAAWAQAHRSLIYQLVAAAREQAFAGAPDPMDANVVDVACHSVRCSIVLSSRYPHELGLLADTLGRVRWGKRSLWRHFTSESMIEESDDDGARRSRLAVTVAFTADLPSLAALTLDGRSLQRDPTGSGSPQTAGARPAQ